MVIPSLRYLLISLLIGSSLAYADEDPVNGRKLYEWNCSVCHGDYGKGDGPLRAALATPPADLTNRQTSTSPDRALLQIVRDGHATMPGWKHQLTEQELKDLLAYLRSLNR